MKKAAIGGGVVAAVWAAPTVGSVAGAGAAIQTDLNSCANEGGPPTGCYTDGSFYAVWYNQGESTSDVWFGNQCTGGDGFGDDEAPVDYGDRPPFTDCDFGDWIEFPVDGYDCSLWACITNT